MTPMVPMPSDVEATRSGGHYSARGVLELAARHGVVVQLKAGRPMMRAASAPPANIIGLLREHRAAVADLLASCAHELDLDPAAPAWPDGVDYWLTHDAVKLAGILNTGGTARWCPSGGLDMWREDDRYVGFSPPLIARLRAADLLPPGLPAAPGQHTKETTQ